MLAGNIILEKLVYKIIKEIYKKSNNEKIYKILQLIKQAKKKSIFVIFNYKNIKFSISVLLFFLYLKAEERLKTFLGWPHFGIHYLFTTLAYFVNL